jgi:PAS domain S-box-containing protein
MQIEFEVVNAAARQLPQPSYDEIFQASVDCLKMIRDTGELVKVSHSAGNLLEFDGACPALGSSWLDLWEGEHRLRAEQALLRAAQHGDGRFVGKAKTFRGNEKWWDVTISTMILHGKPQPFFLVASRDITKMHAEKRSALDACDELEREKANREQFFAAVSHDLRNPLSAARMSAQRIARIAKAEERVASLAHRIDRSIQRADALITDLLDVTKLRDGQPLDVDVEDMEVLAALANIVSDLEVIAGPRFVTVCERDELWATCNESVLRRIVENLATNALKYGDPTHPITLTLQRLPQVLILEVHNQGTPIAPEEQAQLFDLYRRSDTAKQGHQAGWGLGLPLVRGLARSLGGDVRVTSTAAAGTTFTFSLPQPPETRDNVSQVAGGDTKPEMTACGLKPLPVRGDANLAPHACTNLMQTVLANVAEAVITTTVDGHISSLNHAAEQITGRKDADVRGRPLADVIDSLHGPQGAFPFTRAVDVTSPRAATLASIELASTKQRLDVVGRVITIADGAGENHGQVLIFHTAPPSM